MRRDATAPGAAVTKIVTAIPHDPPLPLVADGQAVWTLLLRLDTQWIPDVWNVPNVGDIEVDIETVLHVSHVQMDREETSITIPAETANQADRPTVTSAIALVPGRPHPQDPGSLDAFDVEFQFRIADSAGPASPGRALLNLHWGRAAHDAVGTTLQIPGSCSAEQNASNTGHHHPARADFTCPDPLHCFVPSTDTDMSRPARADPAVPATAIAPRGPPGDLLAAAAVAALVGVPLLAVAAARSVLARRASRAVLFLPLLPLFSRVERDEALESPRRQLILRHVEAHPGIRFHEVKRDLELPHGVLVHHLRILSQQCLILLDRHGRRLHLRLPGQPTTRPLEPEAWSLVDAVAQEPGLSIQEVSARLGWTRRKTSYWIGRLSERGLLHFQSLGPRRTLRVLGPDETTRLAPGPPPPAASA